MQLHLTTAIRPFGKDIEKRFRKAAGTALTRVAWDVRERLHTDMRGVFDRPTPFTLRAFRVQQANYTGLEAVVYAAPMQARYLRHEVEGGERSTKGFEKRMKLFGGEVALPAAGAKLNQYGNMSLAFIKRVAGDTNTTGAAKRFFTGTPRGGNRKAGVWARVDNNKRLVPMMIFANDATYRERLDVSAIAGRTVDAQFEYQLMMALAAL